jgi:hypothetical protein
MIIICQDIININPINVKNHKCTVEQIKEGYILIF